MADFVKINNYSKLGMLGISNFVFYQIAETATNKVKGVAVSPNKTFLFLVSKPISISIKKGLVTVFVSVVISKASNVNKVCLNIQEEIASSLSALTETVPFKIDIKVDNILA
jgi:uncharacterized alkaline shock family protein YloU